MKKRITRSGRALLLAIGLGAVLAALGAPVAMATPKGEFEVFKECPISTEGVKGCIVSRAESGEVKIGKEEVPIAVTQTLQGGFGRENPETTALPFYAASNGETLSKTAQKVPGGLSGLVKCNEIKGEGEHEKKLRKECESIFENKVTGLWATVELALPANYIFFSETFTLAELPFPPYPPALVLPVKIKLENPLLGSSCYLGSEKEPIELALTSGATSPPAPNTSIHGKAGEITSKGGGEILVVKNNTLVGNAFSVPKPTGCGLFGLLDGLVELKLGSTAAGENTAKLNNTIEIAGREAVEESEY